MIIPWVEIVAHAFICPDDKDCVLSVSSPIALAAFVKDKFNIKKHDAALLIRYKNSRNALVIMAVEDIPFHDIYDPYNGKAFIKYGSEISNALVRIE